MLITENNLNQLLEFYPEDKRTLLKLQIQIINNLIIENKKKYEKYPGYSDAIDSVLQLIMQGQFIKEE